MVKRITLLTLLVVLLAVGWISRAADTEPPVLKMLEAIPDIPKARDSYVTYVDYRAVENARPGAAHPKTWAEWKALNDAKDPSAGLWLAAFFGVASGPAQLVLYFNQMGNMRDLMGFDWFDIDQAAEYGEPPGQGRILAGNFDANKIDAAVSQRGYTRNDLNGFPVWCGPEGCENGSKMDPKSIEQGEPFGGDLGRKWTLLLKSGYLVGSGDYQVIQTQADVFAGQQPSLADAAEYRTAAQAITQSGILIQAYFINPAMIGTMSDSVCVRLTAARRIQCLDQARTQFVPIPAYSLLVLADAATETEQKATVTLVYDNEADTQTAIAVIQSRLTSYVSEAARRSIKDILADRGATFEATTFSSTDTGKFAVVITLRAPLATNELKEGHFVSSSLVYHLLEDSFVHRDLGWLAVTFE